MAVKNKNTSLVYHQFYHSIWAMEKESLLGLQDVVERIYANQPKPEGEELNNDKNQPYYAFAYQGKIYTGEPSAKAQALEEVEPNSVMVIPMKGLMLKEASVWDEVSGIQSTQKAIGYLAQMNGNEYPAIIR